MEDEATAFQDNVRRLKHLNIILRAIRNVNQLIVSEKDRKQLIRKSCKMLIGAQGFLNAWIVLFDEQGDYLDAAQAGVGKDFNSLKKLLKSNQHNYCVATVLQKPDLHSIKNPAKTCANCPLSHKYARRGGLVVPLEHKNKVFGALTVSVHQDFIGDEEERELLKEVAGDLGFALYKLELEQNREHYEEMFRRYEHIISSTDDLMSFVDSNYIYQAVNEAYLKMHAKKRSEIIGRSVHQLMGKKTFRKTVKPNLDRALAGERIQYQAWFEYPGAGRRFMDVVYHPYQGDSSGLNGIVVSVHDLTERKLAEEALQQSESRLSEAQHVAGIGSWELDLLTNKLWWSDEIFKMFDLNPDAFEATYEAFLAYVHPDDRDYVNKAYKDSLKNKTPYDIVHRIRLRDGSIKYVNERCQTLYNAKGKPLRSIGTVYDITSIKETELSLAESERRFRLLTSNASDMIYRMSIPEGKYEYVSPASEHIFGYTPEEFYASPVLFKRVIHPDWQTYLEQEQAKLIKGKMSPTYEYQIIHKSGAVRWIHQRNTLIKNRNGTAIAIEGIIIDITERKLAEEALKESEHKYKVLFEEASDGIAVLDESNNVLEINKRICEILGYDYGELHSLNMATLIHQDDLVGKDHDAAIADLLRGKTIQTDYRLRKKDGSYVPTELSVKMLEEGRFLNIIRDITERRQIEALQRDYVSFLETMKKMDQIILGSENLEHMLDLVLDKMLTIFNVERAWLLFPCDPQSRNWHVPKEKTKSGYTASFAPGQEMPMVEPIKYVMEQALSTKEPVVMDLENGKKIFGEDEDSRFGAKSQLSIALYPRTGKPWLLGVHQCTHDREWTEQDKNLFREIGGRVSDSLSSLLLFNESQESKAQYQLLADATFEAIFISKEGICLGQNKSAEKMFGYTLEEAIGRPGTDWVVADDREIVKSHMLNNYLLPYEVTALRKNGSTFLCEIQARVMEYEGQQLRMTALRDISDRKKAEEAFSQELERNRQILETTLDGYILADGTGKIVDINPAYIDMIGYTESELKKMDIRELEVKIPKEEVQRRIDQMIKQGTDRFETQHKHKSGKLLDLDVSITVMPQENGPLVAAFLRDITGQNKARQSLMESEKRFRHIFENSPVPLWEEDFSRLMKYLNELYKSGVKKEHLRSYLDEHPEALQECARRISIININQAAVDLHRAKDKQSLMRKLDTVFTESSFDIFKEEVLLVASGGKKFESEAQVKTLTGEVRDIYLHFVRRDDEVPSGGHSYHVLLATTDITTLKQARSDLEQSLEELRQIYNLSLQIGNKQNPKQVAKQTLTVILEAINPDTVLFYLKENERLELLDHHSKTNKFKVKDALHHKMGECLCGLAGQNGDAVFSKNIMDDTRCTLSECKKAGLHSFAGLPLIAGDEVLGVIGLGSLTERDFSAQKEFLETLANEAAVGLQNALLLDRLRRHEAELENKVTQRTADLVAANKDLEAFAYSVSHDLRAPLRHIAGFSSLLQKEIAQGTADPKYYFNKISDAAVRMKQMIDDLLSFSRVGRSKMKKEMVALNPIIDSIRNEHTQELKNRNVIWEINNLPAVLADANLIKMVLENLISNAIKFSSQEKTARIEIGFKKEETSLEFFISDNGAGFESEYRDKLFNVFQRLHTEEEFPGTGVGLANVKRVIERHGGSVRAESAGKGATFYFTLPVKELKTL